MSAPDTACQAHGTAPGRRTHPLTRALPRPPGVEPVSDRAPILRRRHRQSSLLTMERDERIMIQFSSEGGIMSTSGRPDRILRRRRVRALASAVLVAGLLSSGAPAASAQPAPPPEPVLNEPIGVINTPVPVFIWQPAGSGDTRATGYRFWLQREFDVPGEDRIVDTHWMADVVVGCADAAATECRLPWPAPLTSGTHTWYVQADNAAGIGFWSAGLGFVVP